MNICYVVTTFTLVSLAVAGAIPKPGPGEHKDRTLEKDLSEQKHFDDDEEHNPEYDHEAFLGKEEAQHFEELTPEESKERLAKIFGKIDKDDDGKVSEEELKNWIKYVQNKYIADDSERQWKEHKLDENGQLTWTEYKKRVYGYLESDTDEETAHYKEMSDRDERRWKRADMNGDGTLSMVEFADFLHPEEAEHMQDLVIEETLEDIDKNKDGFIDEWEYIGDFFNEDAHDEIPDQKPDEPDWVMQERLAFHQEHDKNQDGKMDREEVKAWIIPDDYDHTVAESKHLLSEADSNKDGFLTKEEVVNKYDLFVGSQATDFGEALTRHDEF